MSLLIHELICRPVVLGLAPAPLRVRRVLEKPRPPNRLGARRVEPLRADRLRVA